MNDSVLREYWKNKLYNEVGIITSNIHKYSIPIVIIFGTIGNMLSCIIMARKSTRKHVSSVCFRTLAVVDTFVLFLSSLMPWVQRWYLYPVLQFSIQHYSQITCKLYQFIQYWPRDLSAWILVMISIERVVGVIFPYKHDIIFTKRKAMYYIIVLTIICGGKNIVLILEVTYVTYDEETWSCVYQLIPANYWINICFYSFLPFVAILFCNVGILIGVTVSMYKMRANISRGSHNPKLSSITSILLAISFTFLVCSATYCVPPMYQHFFLGTPAFLTDYQMAMRFRSMYFVNIFVALGLVTMPLNSAVNFYIYIMTGSLFRKELLLFFKGLCKQKETGRNCVSSFRGLQRQEQLAFCKGFCKRRINQRATPDTVSIQTMRTLHSERY